ncbi:MAG: bifunctional metallophosphatase/5'-nucleotidase [Marinilabiliaceae bacterium]|nr:bifunctional metallophosphatase/5'-nucleotidase [Marinilabiliaceae bacterium]
MTRKNALYATLIINLLCCIDTFSQSIHILYTTDTHGSLFPYDFIKGKDISYSLANVATYVEGVRDTVDNVILLDAGDILQGTPSVYYYNYISTDSHIIPAMYNFIKYDAVCIGNHDIETGHAVYDKIVEQMHIPVLGCNAVNKANGEPYFTPYTILERGGKRIAVIGLVTPYIPNWLPEFYWSGIEFKDMIESAQYWMEYIKKNERPDAVIGLFHSGYDYSYDHQAADDKCNENASLLVAERVEGFDVVLIGHDHKIYNKNVKSPSGLEVAICDAGTGSRYIGDIIMTFKDNDSRPAISAKVVSLSETKPSEQFSKQFEKQFNAVKSYSNKSIGYLAEEIHALDCLFGSCKFSNIVHASMLKHSGADISFAAPLLIDVNLNKDSLTIGNMFSIYKYENMISVISLSGKEVKDYLEYSYDSWVSNPDETGHILKLDKKNRLASRYYNFDSAAGIKYTVNPFKPKGKRIEIISMQDGTPFDMSKSYSVAMTSYRYNGGGGHLLYGIGLDKATIQSRNIRNILSDLRGLVVKDFSEMGGNITIPDFDNWSFVPESKVEFFINNDKELF